MLPRFLLGVAGPRGDVVILCPVMALGVLGLSVEDDGRLDERLSVE